MFVYFPFRFTVAQLSMLQPATNFICKIQGHLTLAATDFKKCCKVMYLGPPNFFYTTQIFTSPIPMTKFYQFLIHQKTHFASFFFLFRQDCRAGLNFCDELEAFAFRAAIKERIKDFKRKRRGL